MLQQTQSIKYWAEDDRPREKLVLKGKKFLSDSELIAILLSSGTKNKSAIELAREIFQASNCNLQEFSKKNITELCKFKGIGKAKAITLVAAMELGRRRKETEAAHRPRISCSEDIFQVLRPQLEDQLLEEFHVIYLDRGNRIIQSVQISSGGISSTVVDIRVIFKHAIDCFASGIILAHNHPSGQLKPSDEDLRITRKISEAGKMLEVAVLDHIIFTDNGYYSFADSGKM